MVRSLRWRLQAWHALILALAILGFALAVYHQTKRSILAEIDTELLSSARHLEGTLKTMPRPLLTNGFPDRPPSRPFRGDGDFGESRRGEPREPMAERTIRAPNQPPPEKAPGNNPPPNDVPPSRPDGPPPPEGRRSPGAPNQDFPERMGPGRGRPPTPEQWEETLQLPTATLPGEGPSLRSLYYGVFAQNGRPMKRVPAAAPVTWGSLPRTFDYRLVDNRREIHLLGPEKSLIIVGKDVRPQLAQIGWLSTQLSVIGIAVLAVGLIGGWWMTGRAIKPIQQIHETASRINSQNLSERINLATTDQELRDLAAILNSMLARLEQSFDQQNRFTADASHELRTPLSILLSHTELALSRTRTPAEYQDSLQTILRAGTRMKSLVDDLLVLARANAGKLDLRRDELNLKALAEEAAKMFEPLAQQRSIDIRALGADVCCHGDKSRLSQVLANLINNAIHYNKAGGHVELRTRTEPGLAILQVADTGEGIPDSELPHLFDPFYRVDTSRARHSGGSGLGLAICKRIIEAHGGEIRVQSQIHVGSTFEVRLPLAT